MALFGGINVVPLSVADLDAARTLCRDVLELGDPLYDLPEAGCIEFATGTVMERMLCPLVGAVS